MSWTIPRTWVTGEIVTASIMNAHVRDNLSWVTRPVAVKSTEKDIVNTASVVDLLNGEITIPANYIGTNGVLRCRLIGDYLNNSGADRSLLLSVVLGATTLWSDTTGLIVASAARHDWIFEFDIGNQNSAAVQFMSGVFFLTYRGGATTGLGDLNALSPGLDGPMIVPLGTSGTSAVDTTANQTLVVNAQHSTNNASLSIRLKYAAFEVVGQAA